MNKRFIAMALIIFCAFGMVSCQRENLSNGIEYRTYSNGAYVRDITIWAGTNVVIEAEYDGKPVIGLGDETWLKLPSIYKTLILPETIQRIDRDFYDNASNQLQYNEYDNAYYLGTEDNPYFALIKAREIPIESASAMSYKIDGVDTVDKEMPPTPPYEGNRSEIKTCKIHPDTKVIADNAFEGCSYLESITIPGSVKIIPSHVFGGCTSLETVDIEEGVEKIEYGAFQDCYNLKNIVLPSTLMEIACSFATCEKLESINIPEGWTRIHEYMFSGCKGLKCITIPSTVTEIGNRAFENCISLEEIILSEGLESIGEYAFYECSSLASIKIPDTVQHIGRYAFFNNTALTSIEIPVGLFNICEQNAFVGTNITSITVDYSHIECVELDGSLYSKDMTMLVKYGGDPSITSFSVPNGVKYIAECAFMDSTLEEIILPNGLEKIGMGAFYNCDGLEYIKVPKNVNYMGDYAFADCDAIESFTFDCNMNDYDYGGMFDSCDALKEVNFLRRIDSLNRRMFFGCPALESINISYKGRYFTIDGVLYAHTSYDQLVFYPRGKQDKEFILPDSVFGINKWAFINNEHLEKLTLKGDELVYIAEEAFLGAKSLSEININCTKLNYIHDRAFKDCVSLKEIVLPDCVDGIGEGAFEGCISLEKVVLNNKINSIGKNTFRNCSSLKTVELPDQLWFLQDGAFMGCTSLESITIPNYCLNIRGTVFEEQVQIYYDGTVSECAQESYGWQMFKENCESGFYIICSDGKYWHQNNK